MNAMIREIPSRQSRPLFLGDSINGDMCGRSIFADSGRHITGPAIRCGEKPAVSFDQWAGRLCPNDTNKVFKPVSAWHTGENAVPRCVARRMVTDSEEISPISSSLTGSCIHDVWVHIEHDETENRPFSFILFRRFGHTGKNPHTEKGFKPMKFLVNERCIGCGLCATLCPDVFEMTYRGVAQAAEGDVDPGMEECALNARDSCPASAIDAF